MSSPPVPWLRQWWALGGAPAAFVRRDARLTAVCERLLARGEPAGLADDGAAFAALTAVVDLNALMPDTIPATNAAEDPAQLVRRASRSNAAGQASPALESAVGHAPARLREGGRARGPSTASGSTQAGRAQAARSGVSPGDTRFMTGAPVPPASPPITARPNETAISQARDPSWTQHETDIIGRAHDPAVAVRVDALLRRALPGGLDSPARDASSVPATSSGPTAIPTHAAAQPDPSTRLAALVQRVEARRAEPAGATTIDTWPGVAARPLRRATGATPQRRAMGTGPGIPADDAGTRTSSPSVGLRGLVERASFMGIRDEQERAQWPDGPLDAFARLIDTAVRHDGVSIEETIS